MAVVSSQSVASDAPLEEMLETALEHRLIDNYDAGAEGVRIKMGTVMLETSRQKAAVFMRGVLRYFRGAGVIQPGWQGDVPGR